MENKIPKSLAKAIGNPFLKIVAVLILMGIILLVGVAAGALLKFNQSKDAGYKVVDQTDEFVQDIIDNKVVEGDKVDNGEAEYRRARGVLQIDWVDSKNQKQLEMSDRFLRAVIASQSESYGGWNETFEESVERIKKEDGHKNVYVLGTVSEGEYKGLPLVLISWEDEFGMASTSNDIYALIAPDNKYIVLYKYGKESFFISTTHQNAYETMGEIMVERLGDEVIFENFLEISELAIQPIVTDESGNVYQFNGEYTRHDPELVSKKEIKLKNDSSVLQIGSVYFVMQTVDGRVLEYDLVIPFWAKPSGDAMGQIVYSPDIKWNDSSASSKSYSKGFSGGCGFSAATLVDVNADETNFVKTGVVKGHDGKEYDIYEPGWDYEKHIGTDKEQKYYFYNYEGYLNQQEGYIYGSNKKDFFQSFVDSHPILYWKDSYDRWIRLEHVDAIMAVECGKPVIYLYPEETTDMRVEVAPKGGFTFTEPEYGDGWEVTAYPDGTVLNHGDNKVYPYLFWEGRGGAYQSPEKFWVVGKDRVESFLVDTLLQVGLNENEIADFNEFWLPRMQSAPYYKIGFHGTKVMDALAPLDISVEPDSIFRILMDFEELQEPIQENPPEYLQPFARNGFTVVEWGGVIR